MTTADAPQPRSNAARRAWRSFRRWRRGRPFWAGLLCILSASIYFLSVHIDLSMHIQFGPQGFLTWLLPLLLLLCGVLLWVTPQQRIFYGVIAAATAVYGLIGLNLGGFFVGMVLGIVGGALGVSWTPVQLAPASNESSSYEPQSDEPASYEASSYESSSYQPQSAEEGLPSSVDALLSGPLTDTLPTSRVSPLASAQEPSGADDPGPPPAGDPSSPPAGDPSGRRGPRLTGLSVVLAIGLAIGLATIPRPSPALAAPCPTASSPAPATSGTSPTARAASPSPGAGTDPDSPQPSPSPAGGGLLSGIINGIQKVLGLGDDPSPTPSPSTSDSPAPGPSATAGAPSPSTGTPSASPSSDCSGATPAPTGTAPTGLTVNATPSHQITALLYQTGLSYKGIVDLPIANKKTIRCLQFDMDTSKSTPFELQSPFGGRLLDTKSGSLTVSGHVTFYTTKISGLLYGVLPTTYTPDSPPLLVLPVVWFTDATVELVFVQADVLTAPSLNNTIGSAS